MQVPHACPARTGPPAATSIVPTTTYGELHLGSSQMPICLSAHPIVVPTKVVIGKVTLANQVPPVVLPMGASGESTHGPPRRTGSWRVEPLGSGGVAQGGIRPGQEAAGKVGTPVCPQ